MAQRFSENHIPKNSVAEAALSFAAYELSILIWQSVLLEPEDRKRAMAFLRDYRWVLKHGKSRKIRLIHGAVTVLGLRGTAKLLDVYMQRR